MVRRLPAIASFVVLLAPGTLAARPSTRSDGFNLERHLPKGTLGFVAVSDVPGLSRGLADSPGGRILREEEVLRFLEALREKSDEQSGGERSLPFQLEQCQDILGRLGGEAIVAVLGLRASKGEKSDPIPDLVAGLDLGEHAGEFRAWLDLALRGEIEIEALRIEHGGVDREKSVIRFEDLGVEHPVEAIGGGEIDELPDGRVYTTFVGDYFLFTVFRDRMESLLRSHFTRRRGDLVDHPSYQVVLNRTDRTQDSVFFYVNVAAIVEQLKSEMSPADRAEYEQTGMDGIRAFGGAFSYAAGGGKSRVFLHCPGERKGVLGMLALPSRTLRSLARIPAEATFAVSVALDGGLLFDQVLDFIRSVEGDTGIEDALEGVREFEKRVGLRVREDLLASLGTDWTLALNLPKRGGYVPDGAIVGHLRDPVKFQGHVDALATRLEEMPEAKGVTLSEGTYRDLRYHSLSLREGEMPFPITFGIVGDALLVTNGPLQFKRFVQGMEAPLVGSTAFQESAAQITYAPASPASLVFYLDVPELFEWGYSMIPMLGWLVARGLDTANLPLSIAISKHLNPAIGMVAVDQSGILFRGFGN